MVKRLGLDTMNEDFVFDMAWVHKFIKATVDNQCNIANDLCQTQSTRNKRMKKNGTMDSK